MDDAPDALDGPLRVERLANTTSHQRLVQALERVGKAPSFGGGGGGGAAGGGGGGGPQGGVGVGARLVDVMFGRAAPRFGGGAGAGGGGGGGGGAEGVGGGKGCFQPINKVWP